MRRLLLLACLLLVVSVIGYHSVVAGDKSLAALPELAKWVDKYPSDTIDGKTMWDNPAFHVLVDDLFEKRTSDLIFNELIKGVSNPVEKKDDVLLVFVCYEHDCLSTYARFFVDLKKQRLGVCWRNVEDKHDVWLLTDHNPDERKIGACDDEIGFDFYAKNAKD